jgi:hypothetical protein
MVEGRNVQVIVTHSWKVVGVCYHRLILCRLHVLGLAAFWAAFALMAGSCRDAMAATTITLEEAITRALTALIGLTTRSSGSIPSAAKAPRRY